MKKKLLTAIIASTLLGCDGNKSIPSSRLEQPVGGFSFVTPEGWFRNKVPGVDFIIVSAEADYGIEPNIFVDFVNHSPELDDAVSRLISNYNSHREYNVLGKASFKTETGRQVEKITANRKNKKQLPLRSFHYFVVGSNKVVSITCTCAEAVAEKYDPIFDKTISTLVMKKQDNQ